jgi:hypothetical protein
MLDRRRVLECDGQRLGASFEQRPYQVAADLELPKRSLDCNLPDHHCAE